MLRRLRLLGFAALLTLGAGQARADFLLSLDGGAPTGSGPFTYTYQVFLTSNSALSLTGGGGNPASFFTIYDFNGYIPGTASAAGLTGFSVNPAGQVTGLTPATQMPMDNSGIVNITFTDVSNTTSNPSLTSSVLLGTVSLQSTISLTQQAVFYSGASQNAVNGNIANNTGSVAGPLAVPEPASVAMLGIGLVAVLGLGSRRRKKA